MPQPKQQPDQGPPGPPHNPGLARRIRDKAWSSYRPSTEVLRRGVRGWHERGYLPHFDAPYVTQFVTFTIEDAFPVTRRAEWESILREPEESQRRRKLEAWVDRGHGSCWLKRADVGRCVEEILREQDGQSYRLEAWMIMPNHIHLVVDVWERPLSMLLQCWKGRSAWAANRLLQRQGHFWAREYFDTLIPELLT